MSWRTLVVTRCAKLESKLNYLVIRENGSETKVFLDEISTLILESTQISITCALLEELISRKVNIVFCDSKRNPVSQLCSLYGSHDDSSRIRSQILWDRETKDIFWGEIIKEKILNQARFLHKLKHEDSAKMLLDYRNQVEPGDTTNREGPAAKVYFNALWGASFSRTQDCFVNAALNYGYQILLSAFSREIVASGYLTQLGIFHDNMFNHFNLGCDLMEPFRPLVDSVVYTLPKSDELTKADKIALVDALNISVVIDSSRQYLINAIKIYCSGIFNAIESGDLSKIKFFAYEF